MSCLFLVLRYPLHAHIYFYPFFTLSIYFWPHIEDASDLVHKNCLFTGKWTKLPCLLRSSQKLIIEITNFADK